MSEEYEIIFITEEGRAIKNNKTGKIYHSEFEIIDEKNKEIDRLNNIINELEKTLKQDIYKLDDKENPLFYEDSFIKYATERRLTYMYILDKLKELKNGDNNG